MNDGAVGKLEFVDRELRYNGPEPDKSDLPTPVIRPTATVTEIPTPSISEHPEGIITEITTNWYKFVLPTEWRPFNSRLSVSVDADGIVIISDVVADLEILKIATVTDIDSAWAMLGGESEYAYSVFSKDHIFVLRTPAEPEDGTLALKKYDLKELAEKMVILNDGETNEAIRSVRPEHIKRYKELYDNGEILFSNQKYGYGIEKLYCGYNDPLYGIDIYAFNDTESSPLNVNIISDEDGLQVIECPVKIDRVTCIFSFDYDNNGIKEYGIIPYLEDYADNASHEYDHLLIAEKAEGSSDYTVYEFDATQTADYITTQLALTADPENDHNALFSLAGDNVLEVKCENVIDDRDYELKYLCILESEELGSFYIKKHNTDHFTAVFRANLPIKDGNSSYDKKRAPLVLANVTYKGKGVFEPSDITVSNWGKGLPEVEFSEDKHLESEESWKLREEAMEKLADTAAKLGKTQEDIKEQNLEIVSIEEDGTMVLRGYFDPARVYNDSGEMSDDPADYEVEEGLVPLGEEVVMKISEDCPIIYLKKNTGVTQYLLTVSELRTIFDVYNSVGYYFPILYSDPDRELLEYYHDFKCIYMDGVIYYMAEQYYP